MAAVLIDPGSYDCRNFGDLAMLQVAVARWKALWPSAAIAVLTDAPDALAAFSPGAIPVPARARSRWLDTHVFGRLHHALPAAAGARLERLEWQLKITGARSLQKVLNVRDRVGGNLEASVDVFLHWLRRADVVALTGGGALTDAFSVKATRILDTLDMAVSQSSRQRRPVTAIFGQGFGPLDDPALRRRAASVLPMIDFIAIRENRVGRRLLAQLGVRDDRIVVTGDDALELGYGERTSTLGQALGVNVRVSYYSRTDPSMLRGVKDVVAATARRYRATLVPVLISRQPGGTTPHNAEQSDATAIRELLQDVIADWQEVNIQSPLDVLHEVGRCRLVVTGSYHGAVFALAQGIPAIGLVGSPYYRAKFTGLAEQFGVGVRMVDMAETGWREALSVALDAAWNEAERIRPTLLAATRRQIERSREAYSTVARMAADRGAAVSEGWSPPPESLAAMSNR